LHQLGCFRESCACCAHQAMSCGHADDVAHFRRVPFILWGNVCPGYGMLDPDFFDAPSTVWRYYIELLHRRPVICINCWDRIVSLIDGGRYQAKPGGPVASGPRRGNSGTPISSQHNSAYPIPVWHLAVMG